MADYDESSKFGNETETSFNETELIKDTHRLHERIFIEVYSVVCFTSLFVNVLIIFTIAKFPRLRKSLANQTFLYINISQALLFFTSPVTMRLYVDFDIHLVVSWKFLCIINDLVTVYSYCKICLLIVLICDWHSKTYREEKYHKFEKLHKFLVLGTLISAISLLSLVFTVCLARGYNTLIWMIVSVDSFVLILLTVGMNIFHQVKCYENPLYRKRDKLGLVIVNIFVFGWLPTLFLVLLSMFSIWSYAAFLISVMFGMSTPILNFVYLFCYNDDFNIFFKAVLTCRCNQYVNSDMEEAPVVYNDATGVQIATDA